MAKTLTENELEALRMARELDQAIGWTAHGRRVMANAVLSLIEALNSPDETPDQRAGRLLGKWLVENPGYAVRFEKPLGTHPWRAKLSVPHGSLYGGRYFYLGEGPTKAEAILDALRKAGCKDV